MRVTSLKLANLRAIEAAEFHFRTGFNLVVGVNGVGKTTVLDALAVCLSAAVRRTNRIRGYAVRFDIDDMRMGADALDVECVIEIGEEDARYGYMLHKPRESTVPREEKAGMPREQVHDTPEKAEFVGEPPSGATGDEPGGRPLAILFSTNRAVPSERAPAKSAAAGGVNAAFSGALSNHRGLRLVEFEDWMRVQEALRSERPAAARMMTAFEAAVTRFLPDYRNPRLGGASESGSFLLIDRSATTLPIALLSAGERGVVAMEDPAAEAEAVVLIDEIELHLHPAWQRRIVHNLTAAFPRCQFIATTHSPQVIGEVEHDRIQIMADGKVYSPTHSFGVDSSRVLEEIMEAPSRDAQVSQLHSEVDQAIGENDAGRAREVLARLTKRLELGENDPDVTHLRTLIDFVEGND